jgi:hypothetical protein
LLLLAEVAAEVLRAFREQPDAPVGDFDVVEDGGGRELVDLTLRCLRLVRCERADVDETGDPVVRSRG